MSGHSNTLKFLTVDVFTSTKFEGNPLAIVHVPQSRTVTQEEKQKIAFEFNLSETVFIHEAVTTSDDPNALIFPINIFIFPSKVLSFATQIITHIPLNGDIELNLSN